MNVYDFDGTIYDGDSSIDFYIYVLKKRPAILMRLPKFLYTAVMYKIGRKSKTELKQNYFSFLKNIEDIDTIVGDFWKDHFSKIKPWYLQQKNSDDLIISASPYFLLEYPLSRLGIRKIIASEIDKHTGVFQRENCHGTKKVEYFLEQFTDKTVDSFYSDNQSDAPMASLAKQAFFVKGDQILNWGEGVTK